MNDEFKAFIQRIFNLNEGEYSDSLNMEDIANWDSLKHMELITNLESKYNITLEMMEIVNMRSIGTIIETLQGKGVYVG